MLITFLITHHTISGKQERKEMRSEERSNKKKTRLKISILSLSRVWQLRDGNDYSVSTFQSVLVEMV